MAMLGITFWSPESFHSSAASYSTRIPRLFRGPVRTPGWDLNPGKVAFRRHSLLMRIPASRTTVCLGLPALAAAGRFCGSVGSTARRSQGWRWLPARPRPGTDAAPSLRRARRGEDRQCACAGFRAAEPWGTVTFGRRPERSSLIAIVSQGRVLAVRHAPHKHGCRAPEVTDSFADIRSSAGRKRHVYLCPEPFPSPCLAGPHE